MTNLTKETKIIDYKVVHQSSSRDFEQEVNKLLLEGYQPLGLPTLNTHDSEGGYSSYAVLMQVMVKDANRYRDFARAAQEEHDRQEAERPMYVIEPARAEDDEAGA